MHVEAMRETGGSDGTERRAFSPNETGMWETADDEVKLCFVLKAISMVRRDKATLGATKSKGTQQR